MKLAEGCCSVSCKRIKGWYCVYMVFNALVDTLIAKSHLGRLYGGICICMPAFFTCFCPCVLLQINNNGLLSFVDTTSAYTPIPFPTEGQAYVSPFWADVDTRMADGSQCDHITNAVYLKEYVRGTEGNAAILQSIGAIVVNSSEYEMNMQFCPRAADATYEPQWAYVVSWIQVGYYSTNCDKVPVTRRGIKMILYVCHVLSLYLSIAVLCVLL